MATLAYFDGGDKCLGCHQRDKIAIERLKVRAQEKGHIGYLVGHRHRIGQTDHVYVFFKAEPTKAEIQQRRTNGLVGARWYSLST